MSWTINGKPCASIGVEDVQLAFNSQAPDELMFRVAPAAFDGAVAFDYLEAVVLAYSGTVYFRGRIVTIPRHGEPAAEYVQYRAIGPWFDLERCFYEQNWKAWNAEEETVTPQVNTAVILNQAADGSHLTTGEQIRDAVEHAIGAGADLQLGTIDPDMVLPASEERDLRVADVILKMLRYTPDVVTWFDYTTEPATLHIRKVANLSRVTYAIGAAPLASVSPIGARYDLQKPGVVIRYDQVHSQHIDDPDGEGGQAAQDRSWHKIVTDSAGQTGALDTVKASFDLAGSESTVLGQRIVAESFPVAGEPLAEDLINLDWWKSKVDWLNTINASYLSIHDGTRERTDLPNIHIEGDIQPWMDVDSAEITVKAYVDYTVYESGIGAEARDEVKNKEISVKLRVTDATSKTYRRTGSMTGGEPIPSGVAAALYASWSKLHYEGSLSLDETECSPPPLGKKLCLSGGLSGWASMDAVVQSVRLIIGSGRTQITFGPPEHLGPSDLISYLRALHSRRPTWRYDERASGDVEDRSGSGGGVVGGRGPIQDVSSGGGETAALVLKHVGNYTRKIKCVPSLIDDTQDLTIQPRQLTLVTDVRVNWDDHVIEQAKYTGWFLCSVTLGDYEPIEDLVDCSET